MGRHGWLDLLEIIAVILPRMLVYAFWWRFFVPTLDCGKVRVNTQVLVALEDLTRSLLVIRTAFVLEESLH